MLMGNGSVHHRAHNDIDDKHGDEDPHLVADAAAFRARMHGDDAPAQIPMPINEQAQQQAVEQQPGKVVSPTAGGAASKDGANDERRLFIIQV
jgi:hypothetical protein